eukprot:TRINITY_DN17276_c0_g1_i1.p1 TRINITY_DN17276_c0_g1~~TRINITY_DN17276_c0_g1_i1.p1  ORF type:complete len:290 (-),score=62.55 TRINITY_DN17276_c0_g1_i1:165-1034(-)
MCIRDRYDFSDPVHIGADHSEDVPIASASSNQQCSRGSVFDMSVYDGGKVQQLVSSPTSPVPRGFGAWFQGGYLHTTGFVDYAFGSELSITFWLAGCADSGSTKSFLGNTDSGFPFSITNPPSSSILQFFVQTAQCPSISVTSPPCSSTSAFLCDGSVWNHFAMVYTGAQVLSYRNGMPLTWEVFTNTGAIPLSPNDLFLNGDEQSVSFSDLRFYNRSVSADEVCVLANLKQPIPASLNAGVIALYDFSDPVHIGADHSEDVPIASASSNQQCSRGSCLLYTSPSPRDS